MAQEKVGARIANTNLDTMSKRELLALFNNLVDGIRLIATKIDSEATLGQKNFASELDKLIIKA